MTFSLIRSPWNFVSGPDAHLIRAAVIVAYRVDWHSTGCLGELAAGGLLVGFGSRMGNGCTSGHGVCGFARLSARSIATTVIFMCTAIITLAIVRHGFGG